MLAHERYFFTADVELADYGRVLLVGDQQAVEHVPRIPAENANHELRLLPPRAASGQALDSG